MEFLLPSLGGEFFPAKTQTIIRLSSSNRFISDLIDKFPSLTTCMGYHEFCIYGIILKAHVPDQSDYMGISAFIKDFSV